MTTTTNEEFKFEIDLTSNDHKITIAKGGASVVLTREEFQTISNVFEHMIQTGRARKAGGARNAGEPEKLGEPEKQGEPEKPARNHRNWWNNKK